MESYAGTEGLNPDGYSLRPTIEDGKPVGRRYALAEEAHTQRRRMVRSKSSKLIYLVDGDTICRYCDIQHAPKLELYDLEHDLNEIKNIAGKNEKTVNNLRQYGDQKAREFNARRPDVESQRDQIEYEDEKEVEERLEALGYR